jgi:hypothetical protein
MNCALRQEEMIAHRLRLATPFAAYGKPALVRFLRSRLPLGRTSPRLTVTNVFYAGGDRGFMCHFVVDGAAGASRAFVAPIRQLALDRHHPIVREIAAHRRRKASLAAVDDSLDSAAQCPR